MREFHRYNNEFGIIAALGECKIHVPRPNRHFALDVTNVVGRAPDRQSPEAQNADVTPTFTTKIEKFPTRLKHANHVSIQADYTSVKTPRTEYQQSRSESTLYRIKICAQGHHLTTKQFRLYMVRQVFPERAFYQVSQLAISVRDKRSSRRPMRLVARHRRLV